MWFRSELPQTKGWFKDGLESHAAAFILGRGEGEPVAHLNACARPQVGGDRLTCTNAYNEPEPNKTRPSWGGLLLLHAKPEMRTVKPGAGFALPSPLREAKLVVSLLGGLRLRRGRGRWRWAEGRGRTRPVASASSGPMGSCHLMLAWLPASSGAWRLGQFNPLVLSSGYFCGEGGWASCRFPRQRGLAQLHCEGGLSWEKQWGKEGRSRPFQGLPSSELVAAVDTSSPGLQKGGEPLRSSVPAGSRRPEKGLWA